MKKLLAILLTAAMLLSMAACGSKDSSTSAKNSTNISNADVPAAAAEKTTLTVAIPSDAGTFYPYYNLSGTGRMLFTPVYEALFFYDTNTEPEPILAESWTIDEDDMGIVIKLKQGVKFSNGTEMTAKDVLFSLDCILASNYMSNIGDINRDACEVVDDYTVHLRYNSVPGTLFYTLCNLYILSEDYMKSVPEDDWTYNCIGTGAFTWGDYIVGTEYDLIPNEYYREKKALTDIKIKIISEASVQAVQLETGEIDLAMGLNYKDIAEYANNAEDGFTTTDGPAIGSYAMWVNVQQEPYNDVRVRQALGYALDLESINNIAFGGLAIPATNIYSSGTPVWEAAKNLRTRDVDKAKQLLTEAGYPDGVTMDIYCINTTAGQEMANVMISSCAEAGITLNITFSDFATVIGTMRSGAPGYFLTLTYCNGDPYILLSTFAGAAFSVLLGQGNEAAYNEAVALYAEALKVMDDNERFTLYRELMNISYDNCYTTALVDVRDIAVHPDNLHGFWMGGPSYHYEDAYWG